tara:strand:+ start:12242 stop:13144 length:903 start_codon:yes stop_codon:yes gene_type:complete
MNLRSVDLNLLTIFDAIATERNLSRAAEKIGMSQPSVSAALGRLRIEFKDALFVRNAHGVTPTPRAIELQHQVRDILERISATISQSQRFNPETSQRVFNLASIDYGGIAVIPPLLEHLQQRQFRMQVNVWPQYETNLKDLMRVGTVDFAIDNNPITDDDFRIKVLRKETAWCLIRKGHPDFRDGLTMKQYLEASHIVLFPQGGRISKLDEYLIEHGMRRKHGVKVSSFFNMPYIVKCTDYICSLPKGLALHFAQLHDLQAMEIPLDDWQGSFYLMWHASLDQDPAHRWLRNIVIALNKG